MTGVGFRNKGSKRRREMLQNREAAVVPCLLRFRVPGSFREAARIDVSICVRGDFGIMQIPCCCRVVIALRNAKLNDNALINTVRRTYRVQLDTVTVLRWDR